MAMRSRDEAKPVSVFSGRHDRRKVTDWVYEELKSAIVDLRLAPGDPLREATLADQLCRESRKLKKNHDAAGLAALISAFDDVLFEQVRNSRIRALIENLRAHLTRIGHLTAEIPGRIDASVDEHEKIVQAIAARDPELAERQMREHIRSVRDDQLRALVGGVGEP